MKIVTLIENLVYQTGLLAEHGLGLYIDTGNRKLLFDTGQSPAFISNAEKLGIDIKDIDAVIISHGHYDHTGGLDTFLQVNKKAFVYIKKEAFLEKYHGEGRYIGIPSPMLIHSDRMLFVESVMELDEGVFILPDIPILDPVDTSFNNFFVKNGDQFEKDEFNDELFLAINRDKRLSVISSCSHRGITNIVREGVKKFNLPVHLLLGGFHLKNCPPEQYHAVISYLRQAKPEFTGICHCTGVEKFAKLKQDLASCNVFYNMTANNIQV